jgi:hypothetical protein
VTQEKGGGLAAQCSMGERKGVAWYAVTRRKESGGGGTGSSRARWRYEIKFGTLFRLAISSESLRILNYSKDSRKTDLNELWSNRQEVLHGDLQRLYYDLGNMNTITLKINEDFEFQRGIIVKLDLKFFQSPETEWISSVCTTETYTCRCP